MYVECSLLQKRMTFWKHLFRLLVLLPLAHTLTLFALLSLFSMRQQLHQLNMERFRLERV